jgi:hypothetical protein
MRYILQACCVIAFVWPVLGIAQSGDPTGLYSVEGRNVDAKATYRGEVAISKDGEAFKILWIVGNQQFLGTGILRDGKLAVAFQAQGRMAGIARCLTSIRMGRSRGLGPCWVAKSSGLSIGRRKGKSDPTSIYSPVLAASKSTRRGWRPYDDAA